MKLPRRTKLIMLSQVLTLFIWSFGAVPGFAEKVDEYEAVAVADLWYAMEINAEHTKLDKAEKIDRIKSLDQRELLYFVDNGERCALTPTRGKNKVLGYVIKYQPGGFVVVSGEDRFMPVLAFDLISPFVWDLPQGAFVQDYLDYSLKSRWMIIEGKISGKSFEGMHPTWLDVRSKLHQSENLFDVTHSTDQDPAGKGQGNNGSKSIYVYWDTARWGQGQFYNESVLAEHNYQYNNIPTGCVATAHAIKLRYHGWPHDGWGTETYMDMSGDLVWPFPHSVDYGAQIYDWEAMPEDSLTGHNSHVADLMYHCGVAAHMNYEEGSSLADTEDSIYRVETHFRHHGRLWVEAFFGLYFPTSIRGGCPVVCCGPRLHDPSKRHAWLITGYRDSGDTHYYMNLGWGGGSNGWYNLEDITPDRLYYVDGAAPYSQPNCWKYVSSNAGITGTGLLRDPYPMVLYGNSAVPAGGQIWIEAGEYDEVITFEKEMEIVPYKGVVTIG